MTPERAAAVLEEHARRQRLASLTLEDVVTGSDFAKLDASPLQVAIARAADGREIDGALTPEELTAYFGVDAVESTEAISLVVLICGVRSGKCLATGTLIATPAGPVPIESIKVGDTVYSEHGEPIRVLAVHDNGVKNVVSMTRRGRVLARCTDDHVWLTYDAEYSRTLQERTADKIKSRNPIVRKFVEAPLGATKEPHAYVLAAMLGNGCCRQGANDIHISDETGAVAERCASILGCLSWRAHKSNFTWVLSLREKTSTRIGRSAKDGVEIHHYDRYCKGRYAHEKWIDLDHVKTWDRESALEFVAGLLDTDGSVERTADGSVKFSVGMQAKSVIDALEYLCLALWQMRVSRSIDDRPKYKNGPIYTAHLKSNLFVRRMLRELSPHMAVERRKFRPEDESLTNSNDCEGYAAVRVSPDGVAATYDLTVDSPTSLYLTADGLVTHNSFMAACAAIKGCLTADMSSLKQHEVARFAIVAPTVDNAKATFTMLSGIVRDARALRPLVVKETAGEMRLRRPDGRIVEIVVVAAHRGATTMRSRWLIGFVLEEAALFGEQTTGAVVTAEEILRASETRLVPGSQGWIISSPFGPQGLLWEMHRKYFGKPGRVLVVRAPTTAMNPSFDPQIVEAVRSSDPDAAAREYEAQWLDASTTLLSAAAIDRCTRIESALPRQDGHHYVATMDAATRGNSWTLIVSTRARRDTGIKDVIVCARQWTGSKSLPLDPKQVLTEIAAALKGYGLRDVWADEYGSDFVRRLAFDCGLDLHLVGLSSSEKLDLYQGLAYRVTNADIEFPPDPQLRADLMGLKKIARQGSVHIDLPMTPDGRHADYAPSIILALKRRVDDPDSVVVPKDEGEHLMFAEMARLEAEHRAASSGRGPQMPRFASSGRFGR